MLFHLSERCLDPWIIFENNGYSISLGPKAFQKAYKGLSGKIACMNPISKVNLPFIQGTTDRIAHVLRRNNVSTSFKPLCTIRNSLGFVKDPVDPKDKKGVYLVPRSCGIPYIGETGWSIKHRIQEHAVDIRHNCSRTSALTKHVEKSCHHVCIEDSKVIARVDNFHHRKLREFIEIERHAKNLNRDDGWKLSKSWALALSM